MREKAVRFIKIFMGSAVGVFLGRAVFVWLDFSKDPDLYELRSAPWYTEIQIAGLACLAVRAVCALALLVLRRGKK